MVNYIVLRGHIYSDANPLSFAWSKKGSRLFPKSMVSNAENILRFISLGFNPDTNHAQNILNTLNDEKLKQKPYLLQVSIDPDQHYFLYNVLEPIKTDEGRLQEVLRIHDMWVLFIGSAIYSDNPIKKLLGDSNKRVSWSLVSTEESPNLHNNSTVNKYGNAENVKNDNASYSSKEIKSKNKDQEYGNDDIPRNISDPSSEPSPKKENYKTEVNRPNSLLSSVIKK